MAVASGGLGIAGSITGTMGTAGSNVLVQAAVNSVVNQVSTELLTAVITGEGVNLDLGNLVTGAVKAAVFAGVTDAIDTELFADANGHALPREELSFTQNVSKEVLHASASTAIYGGDFKDNVIAAVGDAVAAPAFEYVGHTLTDKDNLALNPNDLSTQALITTSHALVGGTIAELSGGEFSSGAVATAVGHVVGEWMMSGDTLKDVVLGHTTQEAVEQQAMAIASAVGGATVLLTQEGVGQEELNRATSMASSVVENNTLKNFGDKVDFASGIVVGIGGIAWENVEGLMALAEMPPLEQEQALAMLLPQGLSEDETKELNDKLGTLNVVFSDDKIFEGDAYKAGQDLADVVGQVLGAAGILKLGRLKGVKNLSNSQHNIVKGPNGGRGVQTGHQTSDGHDIIQRESGGYYYTDSATGKQINVSNPNSTHGNSIDSSNAQHGYHIVDTDTGDRVKPGISGQPLNADGTSPRAQTQIDRLNEPFEREKYTHEVVHEIPSNSGARREILEWEKAEAARLRDAGEIDPNIHQRP